MVGSKAPEKIINQIKKCHRRLKAIPREAQVLTKYKDELTPAVDTAKTLQLILDMGKDELGDQDDLYQKLAAHVHDVEKVGLQETCKKIESDLKAHQQELLKSKKSRKSSDFHSAAIEIVRGIRNAKPSSSKLELDNYAKNLTGYINMARDPITYASKEGFEAWKKDIERIFEKVNESIAKGEITPDQKKQWDELLKAVNELFEMVAESMDETPPTEPELEGRAPTTTPGGIEIIFRMTCGHAETTDTLKLDRLLDLLAEPPGPGTFTITESWKVMFIYTLPHRRFGEGDVTPGTIGLRAKNGTTYGPWKATLAMEGDAAAPPPPYSTWKATPDVVIPPGTYTVFVSDPESWGLYAQGLGIRAKFLAVS